MLFSNAPSVRSFTREGGGIGYANWLRSGLMSRPGFKTIVCGGLVKVRVEDRVRSKVNCVQ